jgi:hypothetical protein
MNDAMIRSYLLRGFVQPHRVTLPTSAESLANYRASRKGQIKGECAATSGVRATGG